jgi:hypothetical protein
LKISANASAKTFQKAVIFLSTRDHSLKNWSRNFGGSEKEKQTAEAPTLCLKFSAKCSDSNGNLGKPERRKTNYAKKDCDGCKGYGSIAGFRDGGKRN